MDIFSTWISSLRGHSGFLVWVLVVEGLGPGCADRAPPYEYTRPGTTIAQVDSSLGPGEDIPAAQVPKEAMDHALFAKAKGDGLTYRRWVKPSGKVTKTHFGAFKDGKLVAILVQEEGS